MLGTGDNTSIGSYVVLRWYRRWRLTKEGALFRYYNGRRIVYGDVFSLYRRLTSHPANIPSLLEAVDAQQEPETTEFLNAVAEVFGLERYNPESGRGLTEYEVIALFARFLHLLEELKKKYMPWIRLIAIHGPGVSDLKGFPNTHGLLVALAVCEAEVMYLRAWMLAIGASMAMGDIPEDAFVALVGDPERGRFEYQLYQARRGLYSDRQDFPGHITPFARSSN